MGTRHAAKREIESSGEAGAKKGGEKEKGFSPSGTGGGGHYVGTMREENLNRAHLP